MIKEIEVIKDQGIKVYQCVSKKNFVKKGYQGDQVIKGSMCIKGSTKILGDLGVSRK